MIEAGRDILRIEADAVRGLIDRLDESFARAVSIIRDCDGRVVVTGMGKAGIVGHKIQATLASTGAASVFLHPADAIHGDLGMVRSSDIALVLSNSGDSDEVVRLLPHLRRIGARIIGITGRRDSALGQEADVVLCIGHIEEACPIKLAPSASTTAMLALGDALALTLVRVRDFTPEQYAEFHPGGDLGRQLLRVSELMRTGERCPTADPDDALGDAIGRMTRARAGCVAIVKTNNELLGVFTDGDFRRMYAEGLGAEALSSPVSQYMTRGGHRVRADALVAEAMGLFRMRKINALPVVSDGNRVVGLLDVQDIVGLRIAP
jgi:arabinose-5-phosphate isomerase